MQTMIYGERRREKNARTRNQIMKKYPSFSVAYIYKLCETQSCELIWNRNENDLI